MLTDYHVHLRPDEDGHAAGALLHARPTPSATARRRRSAGSPSSASPSTSTASRQALEVWQHPWWRQWARDDVDDYCAFVREETDLRLGIEADYVAGREDRIARFLEAREWDYVVGSVHFVRDAAVDLEGDRVGARLGPRDRPDRIWERYFETLAEAARSGLYDIMAHPDLVKVWGRARPQPERDPRHYYEPAVEAMLEAGVAIELSTAGLRKPVGELYPAPALLEMAVDAGLPIALSTDAHVPEQLGYRYDDARRRARRRRRDRAVRVRAAGERRMEPIG